MAKNYSETPDDLGDVKLSWFKNVCLFSLAFTQKMEAEWSSKTLVSYHITT
jgi:hypothetical protein